MYGAARAAAFLAYALQEQGVDVLVFAPKFKNTPKEVIPILSLPLPFLKDGGFPLVFLEEEKIEDAIRRFQPDVIHAHHPALLGRFGVSLARRIHLPSIFTYHTMVEHWVHYYPVPLPLGVVVAKANVRKTANLASVVTVPNTAMKKKLIEEGVQTEINVIPSGIPLETFERQVHEEEKVALLRELGISLDARIVLYVGRIAEEKNLELLVRSFSRVAHTFADVVLCLVGDGPEKENIQRIVAALGLTHRVIWAGRRTYEELSVFYHMSAVFVFASTTDTQALVFYEAFASGLPVVAVRSSASEEAVKMNDGILTSETVEDFAKGIEELLKKRQEFSPAFPSHVDVRVTSRRMLECYERAIDQYTAAA